MSTSVTVSKTVLAVTLSVDPLGVVIVSMNSVTTLPLMVVVKSVIVETEPLELVVVSVHPETVLTTPLESVVVREKTEVGESVLKKGFSEVMVSVIHVVYV